MKKMIRKSSKIIINKHSYYFFVLINLFIFGSKS